MQVKRSWSRLSYVRLKKEVLEVVEEQHEEEVKYKEPQLEYQLGDRFSVVTDDSPEEENYMEDTNKFSKDSEDIEYFFQNIKYSRRLSSNLHADRRLD